MKFIMHLTIQNIKRRRVRTILTLLGVMIGVVAVVSLLSLGMGVKRELLQGYGDDASIRQITVQTPENNQNKKMLLTDHTIEKLAKLDKVANVYPRYEVFTNIQVGQYTAYTNLVGIPSEQLSAIALTDTSSLSEHARKPELVIGNAMGYMFFHEGSMTSYQDGKGDLNAWIGEKAKVSLGLDENEITDRLTIAGVMQGDADEFSEQSQSIYCDIDVLRAYLKKHAAQGNVLGQPLDKNGNAYTSWVYSSVVVEVGKMEDVEFVVKKLQDMGYQTTNMKEYRDTAMRTVRMLELLLGGIGLISFLVAAIGISNTMTTAVYDRVAEIGTLKVLGCEKRELMAMILLEAGIYLSSFFLIFSSENIFELNPAVRSFCFLQIPALQIFRCHHHILQNRLIVKKIEMLEYHSHMAAMNINIYFHICNINTVKNDISACRIFHTV